MFPFLIPDVPPVPQLEQALSRTYVQNKAEEKDWEGKQWSCLDELIFRESSWNLNASNPRSSAYGLFQILKLPTDTGLKEQTARGLKYIEHRYNEPCSALRHHTRKGWY